MNTRNAFFSLGLALSFACTTHTFAGEGRRAARDASATQPSEQTSNSEKKRKSSNAAAWLKTTIDSLTPTAEQKATVKTFTEESHAARTKWRADHDGELKRLADEFESAQRSKDKEKLRVVKDKSNTLWATAPKFTELLARIRTILTPDQQKAFDAAIQAKRDELKEDAAKFFEDHPGAKGGPDKKGRRASDSSAKTPRL